MPYAITQAFLGERRCARRGRERGNPHERELSARHGRLRAHAALRGLAGRSADRAAIRHQLRGRRRKQHPARRRRLGGLPVGNRRRRALARAAPHEHGIDLRIRLARRLLAPPSPVHRARRAGDGVRRRDRDGAQPASGRGDERSRLGDRHPRLQVDRLSRHARRHRKRATSPTRSRSTRRSPARGRSASTRGARRSTPSGSAARKAASSIAPTPTPTICPIGSRGRRARS